MRGYHGSISSGTGQVLQAAFSGQGGGVLNIVTINESVNAPDNVTNVAVTRTVGQQFNLPNGQGTVRLTLNANGSTTVQSTINGNTINDTSANTLGGLYAGMPPAIVFDFNTLPPGTGTFNVANNIVRRDDGQTSVLTTVVNITEVPGTLRISDPENDPNNVIMIVGQLNITTTNNTTTIAIADFFTDATFTDQVIVENAIISALIALLQEFPAIVDAL